MRMYLNTDVATDTKKNNTSICVKRSSHVQQQQPSAQTRVLWGSSGDSHGWLVPSPVPGPNPSGRTAAHLPRPVPVPGLVPTRTAACLPRPVPVPGPVLTRTAAPQPACPAHPHPRPRASTPASAAALTQSHTYIHTHIDTPFTDPSPHSTISRSCINISTT